MTNRQISLIQHSWESIKPMTKEVGKIFYRKLFEKSPEARQLFKNDMEIQAAKMSAMLSFVVGKMSRFDDILYDIKSLGASHLEYGTKPFHYDLVGVCLLETLAEGLADSWNQEMEDAWLTAYNKIKDAMIEAQEFQENKLKE